MKAKKKMKMKGAPTYNVIRKPFKYELDINWSVEDACYVVHVPELPGCATHGDTPTEAAQMAEDAIESYLQALIDQGEEIPVPIAEEEASGEFPVRTGDPALHRKLKILAKSQKKSLNALVVEHLRKVVG